MEDTWSKLKEDSVEQALSVVCREEREEEEKGEKKGEKTEGKKK